MAGTRVAVQAAFLSQLLILVVAAIALKRKYDVDHDVPFEEKLFPRRDDDFLVESRASLSSLAREMNDLVLPVSVPVLLPPSLERLTIDDDDNDDESDVTSGMERTFAEVLSSRDGVDGARVVVRVSVTLADSVEASCDDDSTSPRWDFEPTTAAERRPHRYPVVVALCPKRSRSAAAAAAADDDDDDDDYHRLATDVRVRESGTTLVRVYQNDDDTEATTNVEAIKKLLRDRVARVVAESLFVLPSSTAHREAATEPRYRVIVTLLHSSSSSSSSRDLLRIGEAQSSALSDALSPFLRRFSPSTEFSVLSRSAASAGKLFPRSRPATEVRDDDGRRRRCFTVSSEALADWYRSDGASSSVWNRGDDETPVLTFYVLVPSPKESPLFVREEARQRSSPRRETNGSDVSENDLGKAIRMANGGVIVLDLPAGEDEESSREAALTDERIHDEMTKSVSLIASQIRHLMGLPTTPPHKRDVPATAASTRVRHEVTNTGVVRWETEALLRRSVPIKTQSVLRRLDSVLTVLEDRSEMVLNESLRQRLSECLSTMRTVSRILNSDTVDYEESAQLLNQALRLIKDASAESTMMEPLDTPTEHYLAVLGPLLLPLVLPMIVGTIKETKRYRELSADQRDATTAAE